MHYSLRSHVDVELAQRRLDVVSQQIVTRDESADGWVAAESVMPTMPIVVVQPARKGSRAMGRAGERRAVGPLAEHGANKPLGLAVRPRRGGPGAAVHEALGLHGGAEDARAIAGSVVGEHAVHADPAPAEPAHRAAQEGGDSGAALIAEDLDIGHARAIVDTDVHELPADAAGLAVTVARDPMAHVSDLPEFLGIQVHQLAGEGPFVSHQ